MQHEQHRVENFHNLLKSTLRQSGRRLRYGKVSMYCRDAHHDWDTV